MNKGRLGEILAKIFSGEKKDKNQKASKKSINKILGLLTVGIMLLITGTTIVNMRQGLKGIQKDGQVAVPTISKASTELQESMPYEVQMEKRLKSILKKMQGVGEVEVMITTTYGKEMILAEDVTSHVTDTREEDQEGGIREINNSNIQKKVVMQNGNVTLGNSPVIVKEKQPEIQGVLVIAEGANNSMVKQSILESAQTLLGIPAHRVTVHQLKNK